MNPNSANQRWSKWVWFVVPGRTMQRPFANLKENCARFGRKAFGAASQMCITQNARGYIVEVLTEGHPVHDGTYVQYMRAQWQKFFEEGFGLGTKTKLTAKLMAGSRQDGTAADQMLIVPSIRFDHGGLTDGQRTVRES